MPFLAPSARRARPVTATDAAAHGRRRGSVRRVLCADDGSAAAKAALDFAIDLWVDTGARLEVVVVWEPAHDGLRGRRPARPDLDDADALDALVASAVRQAAERSVHATPHVA